MAKTETPTKPEEPTSQLPGAVLDRIAFIKMAVDEKQVVAPRQVVDGFELTVGVDGIFATNRPFRPQASDLHGDFKRVLLQKIETAESTVATRLAQLANTEAEFSSLESLIAEKKALISEISAEKDSFLFETETANLTNMQMRLEEVAEILGRARGELIAYENTVKEAKSELKSLGKSKLPDWTLIEELIPL